MLLVSHAGPELCLKRNAPVSPRSRLTRSLSAARRESAWSGKYTVAREQGSKRLSRILLFGFEAV